MTIQINNPKPVVAFMNSSMSWGGGEKWHYEAANDLHNDGFEVHFFCSPGSKIEIRLNEAGISTAPVNVRNLSFLNLVKVLRLKKELLKRRIDTLIINSPSELKTAGLAGHLAKIRNIIFRRGMPHPISNNFYNRWLFNTALHRVIANSESVRNSLSIQSGGIVPAEKLVIIENGMPFDRLLSAEPLSVEKPGRLILSTAGRMVKQKNQAFLLDVAAELKNRKLDFHLIFAGTGPLEDELKNKTSELDLDDVINFSGFVHNIGSLLKITDVFLFPSLYEGSPNTLIEAAGLGLPIVASDIAPNRDILPDKSYGRLIGTDDIEGFCNAIEELHENPQLRSSMGEAVRTRTRDIYDLDQARQKLLAII